MPEDRHSGTPGGGNGSGANVKSGRETIPDTNSVIVTFATPFASVPEVVASSGSNINAADVVVLWSVTTTQFIVGVKKNHGGASHTHDVHWIATDAGDP